jgi:ubiquinone/menaquinone biosynthesis C-methylase UbiE
MLAPMSTKEDWEDQAQNWLAWARTPGHDRWYLEVNLPQFLELLPAPPASILDIGCGEARLPLMLSEAGYEVVGLDSSQTLARAARRCGASVIAADASHLPIRSESTAHVLAFMSLQDIDDIESAVAEVGRVLRSGGQFYVCMLHPMNSSGDFTSKEVSASFVIKQSYLQERRRDDVVERDGVSMTFNQYHRPLQSYFGALERAGLVVRMLKEVQPPRGFVERFPHAARWRTVPIFLHFVAVKPSHW